MTGFLIAAAGGACLLLGYFVGRQRSTQDGGRSSQSMHDSEEVRDLHQHAVLQERERIYADLHDDLGAKLLGLIHAAETPQQADLARAILQDLRDVVTRSRGTPGTLGDVLADIRAEAAQRLANVGIALVWDEPEGLPDPVLDSERALHLYRIVREAISNAIRHAQAARLRVRVRADAEQLRLELTDDGSGVGAQTTRVGSGMRGMRERAAELEGDIRWAPGTEGGTKVVLAMPLLPDPDAGGHAR